MAIDVCVHYNDAFLPDIILYYTLGPVNIIVCYDHWGTRLNPGEEFSSWQPISPSKRFNIFSS